MQPANRLQAKSINSKGGVMRANKKLILPLALIALGTIVVSVLAVTVESRKTTVEGKATGEVLVDGTVVFRYLTAPAGLTPQDRAGVAAQKLQDTLAADSDWRQFHVQPSGGGQGVYGKQGLVALVTKEDAQAAGSSVQNLALDWRDNLALALGGDPPKRGTEGYYPIWEGAKQKWVPILDVDNNGVRIGAAQVAGPGVQVDKCKAVALLGLKFKGLARIKVYVPLPNYNVLKLDRVQGVSVWATGDVKIVNF
jgi:hypothetical protein